jgi:hypothetical protein
MINRSGRMESMIAIHAAFTHVVVFANVTRLVHPSLTGEYLVEYILADPSKKFLESDVRSAVKLLEALDNSVRMLQGCGVSPEEELVNNLRRSLQAH